MDEQDVREFKERVKQITMKYAGASEEQAEIILKRVGARLDGRTHAEAVEMYPDPPSTQEGGAENPSEEAKP